MNLTEEEKQLIELYEKISEEPKQRLSLWAVEIIPPIIFVAVSFYTGSQTYLIVLIGLLMFFNLQRRFKQDKYAGTLKSICRKVKENYSISDSKNET